MQSKVLLILFEVIIFCHRIIDRRIMSSTKLLNILNEKKMIPCFFLISNIFKISFSRTDVTTRLGINQKTGTFLKTNQFF